MRDKTTFRDLYPFQSKFLEINGLKYHYLDEGSGETVVMLHGNPTWSFYYRNLIQGLRNNYRVIVPDHIGCGLSDKPQDYPYCLQSHIENLSVLIDTLGVTNVSVVVHDWGGPIGLGYAVDNPQKIKQIVAFNTTICLTRKFPLRILMCKLPLVGDILIRRCNFFALGAVYMACKNRSKMTTPVKCGYLKPYNTYANRIANLRFVEDIPLTSKHPTWQIGESISRRIDKLKDKPILICWGDRDFCFTPFFLEEWKRQFPLAQIHRFTDAGHYVLEDAFDEILPIVKKFLH